MHRLRHRNTGVRFAVPYFATPDFWRDSADERIALCLRDWSLSGPVASVVLDGRKRASRIER